MSICCSRDALRKGKNDGAPCIVFVAGGGCPVCIGHDVEEDLYVLLEPKQQWASLSSGLASWVLLPGGGQ